MLKIKYGGTVKHIIMIALVTNITLATINTDIFQHVLGYNYNY